MPDNRSCSSCNTPLPPDAPSGVCPKCLLLVGMTEDVPTGHFKPPEPGELDQHFSDYDILQLVGAGGMGAVYRARQKRLDREVAIKILPPEVGRSPAFAARFEREAQTMAKLNHSNIVQIYDFGRTNEFYFFVMEFVDGVTLRKIIDSGGLSSQEALRIIPEICEALQFAHDVGVVHRDIKPENILLDGHGRIKIADFGLAMLLDRSPNNITLTQTNQVMGTLHYMAPEQMRSGRSVDHRADIFSLGVVFYELLTGDLPIGRFESPSRKNKLDNRLDEVVLRALDTDPEQRYQKASEIRQAVENLSSPQLVYPDAEAVSKPEKAPESTPSEGIKSAVVQLVLFIAGNLWLLVSIAVFLGKSIERTNPLMYSFFGAGPWFYPSTYNAITLFFFLISATCFLVCGVLYFRKPERKDISPANTVSNPKKGISASEKTINNPYLQQPGLMPRFSRMAIIGAAWAPFFFVLSVLFLTVSDTVTSEPENRNSAPISQSISVGSGSVVVESANETTAIASSVATPLPEDPNGRSLAQWFLMFTILPLGLTAPFGTTFLGIMSIGSIRRSEGQLQGLGLAVADAVFFPLLLLDALICTLIVSLLQMFQISVTWGVMFSGSILICIVIDFLVVRYIWRKVCKAPENI